MILWSRKVAARDEDAVCVWNRTQCGWSASADRTSGWTRDTT